MKDATDATEHEAKKADQSDAPTPEAGEPQETGANGEFQNAVEVSTDIPPVARCPLVLLDASLVTLELVTKRFWVAAAQQYVSSCWSRCIVLKICKPKRMSGG